MIGGGSSAFLLTKHRVQVAVVWLIAEVSATAHLRPSYRKSCQLHPLNEGWQEPDWFCLLAVLVACLGTLFLSCSNYSAPSGVPKPPVSGSGAGNMVKLPSGASEFGMVEAAPNWDDYMTPGGCCIGCGVQRCLSFSASPVRAYRLEAA